MKTIAQFIRDLFARKFRYEEIKEFHPTGRSMPNGICYQRGAFVKKCIENENAFILDETIHSAQNDGTNSRGGIIIFPACVTDCISDDNVRRTVDDFIAAHLIIPSDYTLGNAFAGAYIDTHGNGYSSRSRTIEISGLSSKALKHLAQFLCPNLATSVVVKDLNKNKIYFCEFLLSKNIFTKNNCYICK